MMVGRLLSYWDFRGYVKFLGCIKLFFHTSCSVVRVLKMLSSVITGWDINSLMWPKFRLSTHSHGETPLFLSWGCNHWYFKCDDQNRVTLLSHFKTKEKVSKSRWLWCVLCLLPIWIVYRIITVVSITSAIEKKTVSSLWGNVTSSILMYCWWFRNPVNSPVEVGSWSH